MSTTRQGLPNLDDAPPPSLRRTPSPGPSAGPPPTYSRNTSSTIVTPQQRQYPQQQQQQPAPQPPAPRQQPAPQQQRYSRPLPPPSSPTRSNGRQPIPKVTFPASAEDVSDSDDDSLYAPAINVSAPPSESKSGFGGAPNITINGNGFGGGEDNGDSGGGGPEIPQISIGGVEDEPSNGIPQISISTTPAAGGGGVGPRSPSNSSAAPPRPHKLPMHPALRGRGGLVCGGCGGALLGRIVNAMGARWHPGCFRCCICNELLENLSSYEHDGRPYCHLDYHEVRLFLSVRCFHDSDYDYDELELTPMVVMERTENSNSHLGVITAKPR